MRPFPKAEGNKRYLLLSMDYFTKWVKVKPLVNIRDVDVKNSFRKTLSPGLESPEPSSRVMDFNLTVKPSEDIAMTCA